jgi:hypothetical protein
MLNKAFVIVPTALGRFQRPTILALCTDCSSKFNAYAKGNMKYQCCVCTSNFDGRQIKDDFKNGVKEGFLCPVCSYNIKDDFSGENVFQKKARGTRTFYWILVIIFTLNVEGSIEEHVSVPLDINNWLVLVCLVMFIFSIYAFVNKNLIKEANVLTTEKVAHNKSMLR